MAKKELSELGSLPTSPKAKPARTCETSEVPVPYTIALRYCEQAYGFDLYYNDNPPTLVLSTWSKNYGIGLYGSIGLICHNLQKGTNLKFKRLEKHRTELTGYLSYYITLEATDPATGSVCSFQTQCRKPHLLFKPQCNEPVDDEWEEEDTPRIHEFYKVPMPKWFSDEALERDSKKCQNQSCMTMTGFNFSWKSPSSPKQIVYVLFFFFFSFVCNFLVQLSQSNKLKLVIFPIL
ncbi:unnamed protein product [Brassica oleracea]